jgi:hypothetical protein
MEAHAVAKNPERVRLGRLGALTVHARGRTNTAPARAAWEAKLAAEVGLDDTLDPVERDRRMGYAMRIRMTRLAMQRWGTQKAAPAIVVPVPEDAADQLRDLARRELRTPRAQACVLILEGLRRAGMDPGLRSGEGAEPAVAKPGRSQRGSGTAIGIDALDDAR